MSVSEVRDEFADALNRVSYADDRVIVTRRGRPVAA
jgi:prevent-host-death family protein